VRPVGTWALALALLGLLIGRLPFVQLRAALVTGPFGRLALLACVLGCAAYVADVLATSVAFTRAGVPRPLREIFVVRGASYLLGLLSPTVGQGGLGLYLARTGADPVRAVAAVLLVLGSYLFSIVLVATFGLASWGSNALADRQLPLIMILIAGFAAWIATLAWKPAALANRRWLAPFFEPGPRGALVATLARIPHALTTVVGLWAALRLWDIPVPFSRGLVVVSVVIVVAAVPIAPAGLGTTEAALVWLASPYAREPTTAARQAKVLALCLLWHVLGLAVQAAIAMPCVAALERRGVAKTD
jgi:uncharacterized membrane protein YbhN (UPF0104 family)